MCGIAGVAEVGGSVDASPLAAMNASLAHRGPDQGGLKVWDGRPLSVALAARRLAILDLSPAGSQPMQTADGGLCLVYNGELYDELALRTELEGRGWRYRSRSDTESLLYGYHEYGLDLFARLNGMFALGLHDRHSGRLVLARDRMGIKPLYYHWDGRRLVFASELRTLALHPAVGRVVDTQALDLHLALGHLPAPHALVRGVRKLEPGSYAVLDAQGLTHHTFWRPSEVARRVPRGDLRGAVRRTVEGAVRRQMRSDVPLGVLLSGGVDSTIVAACAAAASQRPIATFTVRYRSATSRIDPEVNWDAELARDAARYLGASHHELDLDDDPPTQDLLREVAGCADEPGWRGAFFSIALLARLARERGVKVLLTGDGGDELFGGYGWYPPAARAASLGRIPLLVRLLPVAERLAPAVGNLPARVADLRLYFGERGIEKVRQIHELFSHRERLALMGGAARNDLLRRVLVEALSGPEARTLPDHWAAADLELWVRHVFNQRLDRMTMRSSVEARVPFQDNAVLDLALGLPYSFKAPRGRPKHLLKAAFRDLVPAAVLDRPKRAFPAPIGAWVRGAMRSLIRETLSTERVRAVGLLDPEVVGSVAAAAIDGVGGTDPYRVWALFLFQLWAEQFLHPPNRAVQAAVAAPCGP